MKTAKLVIGIISIVLTMVVLFQSCAATVGDALANEGGSSGGVGMAVALLMLVAGIVAIAARNSRGGSIFCVIGFALASGFGTDRTWHFSGLDCLGEFVLDFCGDFSHWFDQREKSITKFL